MAPTRQTYESGTNGAALAVANDGQLFATPSAGGTAVFDNSTAAHGTQCAAIDATAVSVILVQDPGTTSTSGAVEVWFRSPAWPTGSIDILQIRNSAGGAACKLQLNSSGKISVANAGGTVIGSATPAVSKTAWWRVELRCVPGTSSTGEIHAALYLGDSTTADYAYDATTVDAGTTLITSYRAGKITTASNWLGVKVDDFTYEHGRTSSIGPFGGPVTASAVLTGTGAPAFTGSGSLTSSGTLTGTGTPAPASSGALSSSATLTGSGVPKPAAAGSLTTGATLTGSGTVAVTAAGSLAAGAALTGTGKPNPASSGNLTAAVALTGSGVTGYAAAGAIGASATLTGSGVRGVLGTGALTADVTLTGVGSPGITASGQLAADVQLDGAGLTGYAAAGDLAASVVLTGTGRARGPRRDLDITVSPPRTRWHAGPPRSRDTLTAGPPRTRWHATPPTTRSL